MHMLRIVADENIPYAREAFAPLAEVRTMSGRAISREALTGADALLVRSITKVNASLLDGTPVRFVATATIGEDHIDKPWLADRKIGFSSAPGCNANSVGDYVTAALLHLAQRHELALDRMSLGIVGVGNVGKRVHAKAAGLGLRCVLNDPPLCDQAADPKYRPLDEVLACDIITFHVPLEKGGRYPTWHLADAPFLARMKPGSMLINSSRGAVVDNPALKAALREGHLRAAVLDVWEGEPVVDLELLRLVDIGTPHIAGYSFDGKVNGTRQIYEAFCGHFGLPAAWDPAPLLPAPDCPELAFEAPYDDAVPRAVRAVYEIMKDDAAMREHFQKPEAGRGAFFDALRKNYPRRREFFNTRVRLQPPDMLLARRLTQIGFSVDE
jgi:erythronate-4-phosphate dehydrogenase